MCKIKSCTRSRDCLVDTWGRIVSPWALFSLQIFHVFSISQVETRLGQPSTWASYLTPGIRLFAEASTMVVVRMKSLPTVYRLQHAGALGMAQQETLAVTCSHLQSLAPWTNLPNISQMNAPKHGNASRLRKLWISASGLCSLTHSLYPSPVLSVAARAVAQVNIFGHWLKV